MEMDPHKLNTKSRGNKATKDTSRRLTFIDTILARYKEVDEFKYLREMEQKFSSLQPRSSPSMSQNMNMLSLERVHGKVRTIVHVKK